MTWVALDNGKTIGSRGSEGGIILRDDEHSLGARITLEKGGAIAPFSITCGIYGWMCHTRFVGDIQEADGDFDRMKIGLEKVLSIIPTVSDSTPEKMAAVAAAIEDFVKQFP